MPKIKTSCQFKSGYRYDYNCSHNIYRDKLCIFHIAKLTDEEKKQLISEDLSRNEKMERDFHNSLENFLQKISTDSSIEFLDFRGFCFPRINWSKRIFDKGLNFHEAIFYQPVEFNETIFSQEVNLTSAIFNGSVSFNNSIFEKNVEFAVTKFEFAWFSDTKFKAEANFFSAQFDSKAYFHGATFYQKATFLDARIKGDAIFCKTNFCKKAWFSGVVFYEMANFIEATFNEEADFSYSFFEQKAIFRGAIFNKKSIFKYTSFAQECSFAEYERKCVLGESDFRGLTLKENAKINFQGVSLGKASFLDTNLEEIIFRDIKWNLYQSKWRSWIGLWDEICPLEEKERDYEKIAENYRQLVINYESKRDYDMAEHFHIGEMEMRRKKKAINIKSSWWKGIRERLNTYWVYWLLSNYGASYWQALGMLVIWIIFFSMIFLHTGFQPSKENIDNHHAIIEYNLFPDSNHHPTTIGKWFSDYKEAVLFSLSVLTFQRDRFYEPVGWQSQLLLYLAILFFTTQAALVLLAIRRRFRR